MSASGTGYQAKANLPDDTRLWATLRNIGNGACGGCVFDVERSSSGWEADNIATHGDVKWKVVYPNSSV
jgi:hypothetical protein